MRMNRTAAAQAEQDAEAVARIRDTLERHYAAQGPAAVITVAHLLDLLNPNGMWSLSPRPGDVAAAPVPPPHPDADPITGCLPVTAPPS